MAKEARIARLRTILYFKRLLRYKNFRQRKRALISAYELLKKPHVRPQTLLHGSSEGTVGQVDQLDILMLLKEFAYIQRSRQQATPSQSFVKISILTTTRSSPLNQINNWLVQLLSAQRRSLKEIKPDETLLWKAQMLLSASHTLHYTLRFFYQNTYMRRGGVLYEESSPEQAKASRRKRYVMSSSSSNEAISEPRGRSASKYYESEYENFLTGNRRIKMRFSHVIKRNEWDDIHGSNLVVAVVLPREKEMQRIQRFIKESELLSSTFVLALLIHQPDYDKNIETLTHNRIARVEVLLRSILSEAVTNKRIAGFSVHTLALPKEKWLFYERVHIENSMLADRMFRRVARALAHTEPINSNIEYWRSVGDAFWQDPIVQFLLSLNCVPLGSEG